MYSLRGWRQSRLNGESQPVHLGRWLPTECTVKGVIVDQKHLTVQTCISPSRYFCELRTSNTIHTILLWLMQTLVSSLLCGVPPQMLPTNSPLVMAALVFVKDYSFVAWKVGMLLHQAAFDQSYFVQGHCTCIVRTCVSISRS